MFIQLRLYTRDYTRNISVTPYYTFRHLIHDFMYWISSSRFSGRRWTLYVDEINVEELPSTILDSSVREWITNDTPLIFEEDTQSESSSPGSSPGSPTGSPTGSSPGSPTTAMRMVGNRLRPFDLNVIRHFQSILDEIALHRNRITQELGRLRTNNTRYLTNTSNYTPYMAHLQQMLEPGNMEVGHVMTQLNREEDLRNIFEMINNTMMQNNEEQTNVIVAMKKAVFENLEERDTTDEKCTICMTEFEEGDKCKKIKCDHEFHVECLGQWLTECSIKCPLCRTELTESDSEKNYIS